MVHNKRYIRHSFRSIISFMCCKAIYRCIVSYQISKCYNSGFLIHCTVASSYRYIALVHLSIYTLHGAILHAAYVHIVTFYPIVIRYIPFCFTFISFYRSIVINFCFPYFHQLSKHVFHVVVAFINPTAIVYLLRHLKRYVNNAFYRYIVLKYALLC